MLSVPAVVSNCPKVHFSNIPVGTPRFLETNGSKEIPAGFPQSFWLM